MGGAPGILESGDLDVAGWENLGRHLDGLVGPIDAAANAGVGVEDILDGARAAEEHVESGSDSADDDGN